MAESSTSKSRSGCLGRLLVLILLGSSAGLGVALYFISQPQDLKDIGGYDPIGEDVPERNLKVVLENSIERGYPLTLTETEINQWLGRTLKTKQGGLLADQVSLERVWVRLEDGFTEVVMERTVMGRPFTLSLFLKIEQTQGPKGLQTDLHLHGGPYLGGRSRLTRGGRFGKLVVPQGFLLLVMPSYKKLAGLFEHEIHLGFERMARIRFEADRLVLDPREPSGDFLGLPGN